MIRARRGPEPKYNSTQWFNNKCHTLLRGVDYDCTTPSMIIHLRRMAKKINKKITIRRSRQPEGLEIRSWETNPGNKQNADLGSYLTPSVVPCPVEMSMAYVTTANTTTSI